MTNIVREIKDKFNNILENLNAYIIRRISKGHTPVSDKVTAFLSYFFKY